MAKNDFQERQRKMQQTYLDIGEEMGVQKAWDYIQILLRNPKVVGKKNIFGKRRMKIAYEELSKIADYYKKAFSDDKEADYKQEELDGVLREIWEDDLVPFKERYPYIRQTDYSKAKKSWR